MIEISKVSKEEVSKEEVTKEEVEEYKLILQFPEYEISTIGNIRNKKTLRVLTSHFRNGYKTITICGLTRSIHRFMAIAFIPNPNNYSIVSYCDGTKTNIVSNLKWSTKEQVVNDNVTNNTIKSYTRSVKQFTMENIFIKEHSSTTEAAEELNCTRRAIDLVCNNINNSAKGFKWKFSEEVNTCDLTNAKNIIDYEQYQITDKGDVYSIRTRRSMRLQKNANGYMWIQLCVNKIKKNLYIHTIVANHFINNNENKPYVNHIDGDKTNNNVCNLEWCTQPENNLHYYQNNKNIVTVDDLIVSVQNIKL